MSTTRLPIALLLLLVATRVDSYHVTPILDRRSRHSGSAVVRRRLSCTAQSSLNEEERATVDSDCINTKDDDESNVPETMIDSYSYSYPKYRIDFTTLKGTPTKFLWPWQRMQARRDLESKSKTKRQASSESMHSFCWIDSSSKMYSTTTGTTGAAAASSPSEQDVSIMALLWRMASNQTMMTDNHNRDDTAIRLSDRYSVTMVFPDLETDRVIRCWVEMMEWLVEYCHSVNCSIGVPARRLDALSVSYDNTVEGIPTTTLTLPVPCGNIDTSSSANGDDASSTQLPWPSHETLMARTKSWVQRVLVNMGICPFTKSTKLSGQGLAEAGVPVGLIAYHSSFASPTTMGRESNDRNYQANTLFAAMCQLQADTWEAILAMLQAGPDAKSNGVSSILLAAPAWDEHFELWSGPVFGLLNAGVVAANAMETIGVVCFHPHYQTPDGSSFPGFGQMHSVPRLQQWLDQHYQSQSSSTSDSDPLLMSAAAAVDAAAAGGAWQRRTPHATINVLRAEQLKAAENYRSTPDLYVCNILQLQSVGWDQLQEQLSNERQQQF